MEDWRALLETVKKLRAPGGCPWDRAQTHHSLRPYVIEEAFEVLDALDRVDSPDALRDADVRGALVEELGDLLMQVLIHSEIASETKAFDANEVVRFLNEKLIRRHPHVFGEEKAADSAGAFTIWEKQKAAEKQAKNAEASVLDGMPRGLPALQLAARMNEKVVKVGFKWKDLEGSLAKVDEEWNELKAEIEKSSVDPGRIENEIGDLLLAVASLAARMNVAPENALRKSLGRFESRFRSVERSLRQIGKKPEQSTLEEMGKFWEEAKRSEKT